MNEETKSLVVYFLSVTRMFCSVTDNGEHRTLCGRVGTKLADFRCHEIPEVRRLIGTTSADTWHHTLGMSAVHGNAAAASLLLSEVDRSLCRCSSTAQATSLADRFGLVVCLVLLCDTNEVRPRS